MAINRHQRTFESTVLHAIGARMNRLLRTTVLEYALSGTVVMVSATLVGGGLGHLLLAQWIELPLAGTHLAVTLTGLPGRGCVVAGARAEGDA